MKTLFRLSLVAFGFLVIATGCRKVNKTLEFTANVPTYMTYENLRGSVFSANDEQLERPGKIFLYNNLILINDFERGIHIYDNSNPNNPGHVGFINIPGNIDIAVRDNILYADSYVDLVAIDISNPTNVREVGRSKDVLSYTIPSSMDPAYPVAQIDPSKGVVVGYEIGDVEEKCANEDCRAYYNNSLSEDWVGSWSGSMMSEDGTPVSFSGNANNVRSTASSSNSGIAGSMARFMMIDNYLYVITTESTVEVFDINTNGMYSVNSFQPWANTGNIGTIETLFTLEDRLFIGSNTGMLIYDVSSPSSPSYISNYTHMTSCDPVVANDDYAFITLRSGSGCNGAWINELEILDITDIMSPREIQSVSMTNPHGLDIDDNNDLLFVCDGYDGLKVYDYSNIESTGHNRLLHMGGFDTYDVILDGNKAFVIGAGGLKQFSYNSEADLVELSEIALD